VAKLNHCIGNRGSWVIVLALASACSTVEPTDGLNAVVRVNVEPPGANCTAGGTAIRAGVDRDRDGVLDEAETQSVEYVCAGVEGTPGSPGASGLSFASSIVPEPPGARCAAGGQAVSVGPDLDEDGVLDSAEVTRTEYVCNGPAGAGGEPADVSLVSTVPELPGPHCAVGGLAILSGVDDDGDGALGELEIRRTEYLCHGASGADGAVSLLVVRLAPPDARCPAGGLSIVSGLDVDGDGTLEDAEVTSSGVVCNPQPVLLLSPLSIDLEVVEGAPGPAHGAFQTVLAGGVVVGAPQVEVDYGADSAGWLTATVEESGAVSLSASGHGLAAGTYSATVRVDAPATLTDPQTVAVSLTVRPRVTLRASAASLWFHAVSGEDAPGSQQFWIDAANGAGFPRPTVSVISETPGDWLRVAVTGDAPPYLVVVQPGTGIPAGRHRGTITIELGALADPVEVAVAYQLDRNVTVSCIDTFWSASGSSSLSAGNCSVDAAVEDDDGTTRGLYAEFGTDPSTMVLRGVPTGPYEVRVQVWDRRGYTWLEYWITTSAGELDLGRDYGGRTVLENTNGWSTPVTFSLSGLSPWQSATDALQLFSWGGVVWDVFDPSSLEAGDTSTDEAFDWNSDPRSWYGQFSKPLLIPDDVLYVVQQREEVIAGSTDTYWRTASAGSVTALALSRGVPASTSVAMSAVADKHVSVEWRTSAFEDAVPPGVEGAHALTIAAMPHTLTGNVPLVRTTSLDLVEMSLDGSTPVEDRTYDSLAYGDFLPPDYREFAAVSFTNAVEREFDAYSGTTTRVGQAAESYAALEGGAELMATPLVGAVQAPKIAGRDAMVRQQNRGADQVLLTWDEPVVGLATRYTVSLYYVDSYGNLSVVRRFITSERSITAWRVGLPLVAVIQAEHTGGSDPCAAPFRRTLPWGRATLVTAPFFSW
jgi:hypothetical protein